MHKEPLIEFEGTVLGVLPDTLFRVRLDNEHEALADTSGRMKRPTSGFWRETESRSR
jgi:translation initiation factor IF-1